MKEKEFKREDGLVVSTSIDDTLMWESGYTHLNIHDEWEEVKESVSFNERIEEELHAMRDYFKGLIEWGAV